MVNLVMETIVSIKTNLEDNWIISCTNGKNGDELKGSNTFELIHENTDKHLKVWTTRSKCGRFLNKINSFPNCWSILLLIQGVFFKEPTVV